MLQTEKEKQRYGEMVKAASPSSKIGVNSFKAFITGGAICAIGQIIHNWLIGMEMTREDASLVTAIILIIAAALLTALGLYNKMGKFAGAGTFVPITGFANAMAAPAIEHKKEGMILGLGAKMFTVAGPVIVYGTLTSVVVGLIYYFF